MGKLKEMLINNRDQHEDELIIELMHDLVIAEHKYYATQDRYNNRVAG